MKAGAKCSANSIELDFSPPRDITVNVTVGDLPGRGIFVVLTVLFKVKHF